MHSMHLACQLVRGSEDLNIIDAQLTQLVRMWMNMLCL